MTVIDGVAILAAGKRKAGRRTASGRLSRAKGSGNRPALLDEHRQGIEARMRRFGLTEAEARDQRSASVVGRLRLVGVRTEATLGPVEGADWLNVPGLGERQYQAAVAALGACEAMRRAVKSPAAVTGQGEGGNDPDGNMQAQWAQRVVEAWEVIAFVVAGANTSVLGRRLSCWAALDMIVLRDEEMAHLVPDLKVALLALADHFERPDVAQRAWAAWRVRTGRAVPGGEPGKAA